MDNILDNNLHGSSLSIDAQSRDYLVEASKWAKFLAIVGFVMLGLIVALGIFFGFVSANAMATLMPGGGIFMLLYVLFMCALYFFPTMYLYKFAKHTKMATVSSDMGQLSLGLKNLKSLFKFMGILMIIVLVIYALIFLFGGAGIIAALLAGGGAGGF